jgi:hypothetical protein
MRIESRKRILRSGGQRQLTHYDLVFISESEDESALFDLLGQPGSTITGQVRLADGYGEHYLLVQPRHTLGDGFSRDFEEHPTGEPLRALDTLNGDMINPR